MVCPIGDWDSGIWRHLRFRHGASQRARTRTLWKAELARSTSPDHRPNDKVGFLSEPAWFVVGRGIAVYCLPLCAVARRVEGRKQRRFRPSTNFYQLDWCVAGNAFMR